METKTNKMNNKNVKIGNGDIVNGDKNIENITIYNEKNIYVTIENSSTLVGELLKKSNDKKNEYSDFYKKYITKFKELDNYTMSLIYPKMIDKKYNFTSNTLICRKKDY